MPQDTLYIIAAPTGPTTWLGRSAALLTDVVIAIGLVFSLVLVPVLAIKVIAAAVELLLGALRGVTAGL